MKIAVNFKVNLSQINQSRCFNGEKGKYVDLTCFINIDEVGQYGDNGVISQQTSKEERDQGVKMPIIGNTSVFWRDDGQPVAKKDPAIHEQGMQQANQAMNQQAPQLNNAVNAQQAPQQYAVGAGQQPTTQQAPPLIPDEDLDGFIPF